MKGESGYQTVSNLAKLCRGRRQRARVVLGCRILSDNNIQSECDFGSIALTPPLIRFQPGTSNPMRILSNNPSFLHVFPTSQGFASN
jgi:hypothetical protein